MVKPPLVEFQSLWPRSSRQRKRTETRDQKRERYGISPALSNSSGRPSLRGERDERKTWSTLPLNSAENAGSSKQDHPCMMTEAQYYPTYGCNGLCRLVKQSRPEG